MISYSISQLERISGIKAHTIRIWEKRYNLLTPHRTETNIRFYDNEHLKTILNVSTLLEAGLKISKVASLGAAGIAEEILKRRETEATDMYSVYVNKLIPACMEFDRVSFEKTFNACVLKFGLHTTVEHVLYPFFHRIGLLWQSSRLSPAQEHFASNIARMKLFSAIDGITVNEFARKHCLLFLPQHEEHETGLLYCNYLLLQHGYKTTYLGQRLPYDNIKEVTETVKPTHLILFFIAQATSKEVQKYIDRLAHDFPMQSIVACGSEYLLKIKPLKNVSVIKTPKDFKVLFKLK